MSTHRCNARCYDAKGPDCHCACGGVNHGVGVVQARENARKLGLIWKQSPRYIPSVRTSKRAAPPEQGCLFASHN
jgi:hypothetical protein